MPTKWTPALDAKLMELTGEGRSASRIAGLMGCGFTRSAIIGRWYHLRKAGRQFVAPVPCVHSAAAPHAKIKTTVDAPKKPVSDVAIGDVHFTKRGRSYNKRGTAKPLKLKPVEPAPPVNGAGVTLMQLTSKTCRWPIGDPGREDFHFCGQIPREGSSYCDFHRRASIQPHSEKFKAKHLPPIPLPNFNGLSK